MLHHIVFNKECAKYDRLSVILRVFSYMGDDTINVMKQFLKAKVHIFDNLKPSTLTAQGFLSNVRLKRWT